MQLLMDKLDVLKMIGITLNNALRVGSFIALNGESRYVDSRTDSNIIDLNFSHNC